MKLISSRRAVILASLLGILSYATLALAKPDIKGLHAGPITVNASLIREFSRSAGGSASVGKLKFRGGLALTSPSPYFGGWSGLIVGDDGKSLLAISDAGLWLTAQMTYDGTRPTGLADARLGPLPGQDGKPLARGRDSESVALDRGTLAQGSILIGFERRHRIERFGVSSAGVTPDGGRIPLPAAARKMGANDGLEGMTVMRGGPYKGSLVAFSERLYDQQRNHTGWLWTRKGPVTLHLKNIGDFDITDLSSLDDGTLFVLERRFRWTEGVKVRLRRIAPGDVKPGRTIEGETLMEADLASQIDNMEGLSVTRLPDGEVLVTMISDDNYNHILQRTLLLQFTVDDNGQAKARPQG